MKINFSDFIAAIRALAEAINAYEKRLETLATKHNLQELRSAIAGDLQRILDANKTPRFVLLVEGIDEEINPQKKG